MFKLNIAIKTGLLKNELKQKEFAAAMKLTEAYVSWLCNGKATPSMPTLQRMATVFGVELSEFIKWGEE